MNPGKIWLLIPVIVLNHVGIARGECTFEIPAGAYAHVRVDLDSVLIRGDKGKERCEVYPGEPLKAVQAGINVWLEKFAKQESEHGDLHVTGTARIDHTDFRPVHYWRNGEEQTDSPYLVGFQTTSVGQGVCSEKVIACDRDAVCRAKQAGSCQPVRTLFNGVEPIVSMARFHPPTHLDIYWNARFIYNVDVDRNRVCDQKKPTVLWGRGGKFIMGPGGAQSKSAFSYHGKLTIEATEGKSGNEDPPWNGEIDVPMDSSTFMASRCSFIGVFSFGEGGDLGGMDIRGQGRSTDTDDILWLQVDSFQSRFKIHARHYANLVRLYSHPVTSIRDSYFVGGNFGNLVLGDATNGCKRIYWDRCVDGNCESVDVGCAEVSITDSVLEGVPYAPNITAYEARQLAVEHSHVEGGGRGRSPWNVILGAGGCDGLGIDPAPKRARCALDSECAKSGGSCVAAVANPYLESVQFLDSGIGPFALGPGAKVSEKSTGLIWIASKVKGAVINGKMEAFAHHQDANVPITFLMSRLRSQRTYIPKGYDVREFWVPDLLKHE